jgi:hypothetical protein
MNVIIYRCICPNANYFEVNGATETIAFWPEKRDIRSG